MSHISVQSERVIEAKPEDVFAILADYKEQRPRILPPNFVNYKVEKGGQGGGTVVSYALHAAGRERPCQMIIDEPQRGQMLAERDNNSSLVTRWSVRPVQGEDNKETTLVKIESEWEGGKGVGGFFERTFAPLGLSKIYREMLRKLAFQVQSAEQRRKIMLVDRKALKPKMGIAMIAFGSAMALAAGASYWRTRSSAQQRRFGMPLRAGKATAWPKKLAKAIG